MFDLNLGDDHERCHNSVCGAWLINKYLADNPALSADFFKHYSNRVCGHWHPENTGW